MAANTFQIRTSDAMSVLQAAVGYYATTPDLGLAARYSGRSTIELFSTRLFFRKLALSLTYKSLTILL